MNVHSEKQAQRLQVDRLVGEFKDITQKYHGLQRVSITWKIYYHVEIFSYILIEDFNLY